MTRSRPGTSRRRCTPAAAACLLAGRRVASRRVRRASDLPGRRSARRISGRAILIAVGVAVPRRRRVRPGRRPLLRRLPVARRPRPRRRVLGRDPGQGHAVRRCSSPPFAVLAGVNLLIADRLSPSRFPANVHPYVERFHELFGHRLRLVRYAGAGAARRAGRPADDVAVAGVAAVPQQPSRSAIADAQFGADVGFYVFELPFLGFVLDWLFVAMVLVLLLTLLAHVLNGGVVFASPMPSVRPATKGHIAVLLAVLAALKAADYWVTPLRDDQRAARLRAGRHVRRRQRPAAGADAADADRPADRRAVPVDARAPVRGGCRSSRRRCGSSCSSPAGSSTRRSCSRSSSTRTSRTARRRTSSATSRPRARRWASTSTTSTCAASTFESLTAAEVEGDLEPLQDVRLLNPTRDAVAVPHRPGRRGRADDRRPRRRPLRARRAPAAGADRRPRARRRRQPEPELAGPPPHQHPRLRARDGAGRPGAEQRPPRLPAGRAGPPRAVLQPEPQRLRRRRHVGRASGPAPAARPRTTSATTGVQMSSFVRRAAFALAFLDYNVLGSGAIERRLADAVGAQRPRPADEAGAVPVLRRRPVPGRRRRPGACGSSTPTRRRAGTRTPSASATRSSSPATAASPATPTTSATASRPSSTPTTASVTLLRHRRRRPDHPGVAGRVRRPVHAGDEMPDELREHLRYPEDLFRVQTDVYSKYQLDAGAFFEREGAWSVAQAPSIDPAGVDDASDTPATAPTDEQHAVGARRRSRRRAGSSRTTRCSAEPSGEGDRVRDPAAVRAVLARRRAHRAAGVHDGVERPGHVRPADRVRRAGAHAGRPARRVQLRSTPSRRSPSRSRCRPGGGNRVRFGDLQLVPVADGLLWVRPFYAAVPQGSDRNTTVTSYRFVIVSTTARGGVRASRSARRSPSCSPASRPTSATASAPTRLDTSRRRGATAARDRRGRPRRSGRAARRRPTSCCAEADAGARRPATSASTRRRSRRRKAAHRPGARADGPRRSAGADRQRARA